MAGLPEWHATLTRAQLAVPLPANDQRADYMRASVTTDHDGRLRVTPFPRQDSSHLRVLAQADALAIRPPHAAAAKIDDFIDLIRLDEAFS